MPNAAILISAEVGRLIVCWGALHSRHLCLAMCGPFAPCRSKEAGILCIIYSRHRLRGEAVGLRHCR